jgi:hypothetical protein
MHTPFCTSHELRIGNVGYSLFISICIHHFVQVTNSRLVMHFLVILFLYSYAYTILYELTIGNVGYSLFISICIHHFVGVTNSQSEMRSVLQIATLKTIFLRAVPQHQNQVSIAGSYIPISIFVGLTMNSLLCNT